MPEKTLCKNLNESFLPFQNFSKEEIFKRIDNALLHNLDMTFLSDKLEALMLNSAKRASVPPEMVLLPYLTITAAAMGVATVKPFREIRLCEPNILWTCVSALPGERVLTYMYLVGRFLCTLILDANLQEYRLEPRGKNVSCSPTSPTQLQWDFLNEQRTNLYKALILRHYSYCLIT